MSASKLTIDRSKDTFLVQTQKCSLQLYSHSPILEIIKYLQEYELYRLNSAIASMNLRINQYGDYAQSIPKLIEDRFRKRVEKAVEMCEKLILSIQMHKAIQTHYYGSIFLGFQSNVYENVCDPYKFDINQFKQQYEKVVRFLQKQWSTLDPIVTEEHRKQFQQNLQKIKKKSAQKKQSCIKAKVMQPYLAQNKQGTVVNATELFGSYFYNTQLYSFRLQETLKLNFYDIYKQIATYSSYQSTCFLNLQNYAYYLTRVYNSYVERKKMTKQAEYQIKPSTLLDMKEQGDILELDFFGHETKAKPIIHNSLRGLTFKSQILVHNVVQRNEQTMKYIDDFDPQSSLATNKLNLMMPVDKKPDPNNPSDIYYYEQRKIKDRNCFVNKNIVQYRKFASTFQQYKDYSKPFVPSSQNGDSKKPYFQKQVYPLLQGEYNEQRRQREKKKQLQNQSVLQWSNIFVDKNIIAYPYAELIKEQAFWQYRPDKRVHLSNDYCRVAQKTRREISYIRGEKLQERQKREEQLSKKWNQERIKNNEAFQLKMKEQESMKRNIYREIYKKKNYAKFAEILKLSPVLQNTDQSFVRYGIKFNRQLQKNSPDILNKAFFYYFKERYYKQNETAIDSSSVPLFIHEREIGYDKFLQENSLKKIQNLIKEYSFFFLAYLDLIFFQKVKNRGQQRTYNFVVVCYTDPLNSQKFLYEMRRRINIKMKETIMSQYYNPERYQQNPLSKIYSRVQVIYRYLHKRHRETQSLSQSEVVGSRICKQIWEELQQWQMQT